MRMIELIKLSYTKRYGRMFYWFNIYDKSEIPIFVNHSFVLRKYVQETSICNVNYYIKFPLVGCSFNYNKERNCYSISYGNKTLFLFAHNKDNFKIKIPSNVIWYDFVFGTKYNSTSGIIIEIDKPTIIDILEYGEYSNVFFKLNLNGEIEIVNLEKENNLDINQFIENKII